MKHLEIDTTFMKLAFLLSNKLISMNYCHETLMLGIKDIEIKFQYQQNYEL